MTTTSPEPGHIPALVAVGARGAWIVPANREGLAAGYLSVYKYARCMLGDPHSAEQVAFEVARKAWGRKVPLSETQLLRRAVKETQLTARKYRQSNQLDLMVTAPLFERETVRHHIETGDVQAVLKCLAPKDRAVVILSLIHHQTLREISRIVRISQRTAMQRLARGLNHLQRLSNPFPSVRPPDDPVVLSSQEATPASQQGPMGGFILMLLAPLGITGLITLSLYLGVGTLR